MKISTWNVNSLNVRLPQLQDWLKISSPDVVGLQELKGDRDKFPFTELESMGYNAAVNGQRTYNGVALISRHSIENVTYDLPNYQDEEKRLIAGTINGIRVVNIYVPNGQSPESDKYQYKLAWLKALHDYLQEIHQEYEEIMVMGDFNIAPSDDDVYNPALWRNKILCTDKERDAFIRLLQLGFVDAVRMHAQVAGTFTWWDYRHQAFEKNHGMRIDHLLLSSTLSRRLISSHIDINVRGNERPSDHAPVSVILK